ncbi:MAG: hypothetical protein Tp178MES00d2C33159851_64 [Prokaryotic dsDNA virus sp.]|nr:MAG: hypothetical protein Tp178MES00d2C33159851_64 [Prokaryotic dsDNA virus sp.]|tara:strand:- start:65354 stop:65599 length:246 start_codon:yes stop_codon:yes gene_type:complete
MTMVDIAKGFRQYSPEDLRDYGYRGLLRVKGMDINDFLEYIFEGMITEEEAERIALAEGERAYDEGFEDGKQEEKNAQRWA